MKLPVLFMKDETFLPGQTAAISPAHKEMRSALGKIFAGPVGKLAFVTVDSKAVEGELPEVGRDCREICTIGTVESIAEDGKLVFRARTDVRAKVISLEQDGESGTITGEFDEYPYPSAPPLKIAFARKAVLEKLKLVAPLKVSGIAGEKVLKDASEMGSFDEICGLIANLYPCRRRRILEEDDILRRAKYICDDLAELDAKARNIKESIKKKLEAQDEENEDIKDLTEKVNALAASDEVKAKLNKDLRRCARMPVSSPEYSQLINYLETAVSLPWNVYKGATVDLEEVRRVLDEDHYGIEDVKKRVIEYLAVMRRTGGKTAPVLCLVGAPGVGKTSVAKSIARALGKEYIHISLGGIHDEAEIRGHRKTYIGAMPGRIISELAGAKSSDPLFLLDEVDKLTSDMRGDPSGALLEVLDPAQNGAFRDNYLELPYDLSKVFFIATANTTSTIQKPLLDRMEVIEMSGYTEDEKLAIAKKYLIPKQLEACGLLPEEVTFLDDAVDLIIRGYTRESGVRELERKIGSVCRKITTEALTKGLPSERKVDARTVSELLGLPPYSEKDERTDGEIGCVNGLAWTAAGGVTLPIEVKLVPSGKGDLILTGSLGDVMKESAKIALSVVRSETGRGLSDIDVHIHVPAGATPKDGPSAGIALATALDSAFTDRKVSDGLAMTGELTLSGKVLKIGGLKEKLLAAKRAGMKKVIIPEDNAAEASELPDNVKSAFEIVPVSAISEVFEQAFGDGARQ